MAATGLAAGFAVSAIRVYQCCLSGLKPPCCRFQPSCSQYAREAILAHGLLRGAGLAIHRLLRCHPFYRGSAYDPVPAPDPTHGAPLEALGRPHAPSAPTAEPHPAGSHWRPPVLGSRTTP